LVVYNLFAAFNYVLNKQKLSSLLRKYSSRFSLGKLELPFFNDHNVIFPIARQYFCRYLTISRITVPKPWQDYNEIIGVNSGFGSDKRRCKAI
jgi:hypothetical protein